MDPFSYLSVLISIVLGLGITNLLGGVATLMRGRSQVRPYWPLPIWLVTLFLMHVQTWWTMRRRCRTTATRTTSSPGTNAARPAQRTCARR